MSGGVDSSVTAALLKDQGYQVVGAMMRFWPDDKRTDTFDSCCSPDAAYEARRVAEQVGVPFYLLDYREQFQRHIVGPFIDEYSKGRTPNPCVNCNTKVKFDELVKKAKMLGCRYVATGHYVKRVESARGEVEFHRGDDPRKDQTYFLWGTPRDALPYILFPVGELEKPRVREIAAERGLLTAQKPESQNICFVPGKVQDFVAEHIPRRRASSARSAAARSSGSTWARSSTRWARRRAWACTSRTACGTSCTWRPTRTPSGWATTTTACGPA